ncbi:MAG: asparagine synthase (glutamine-hydrolyzing) [Afipia sp.]|nr:asparagine synthase (glutamine-hydrolyzing) [Afipia sp.]
MCGIAGIMRTADSARGNLGETVGRMIATLVHRGPDADGVWADAAAKVCLGHRRLSILDLTAAGAQPMHSDCGRFTVSFNGEIYNHLDIRKTLEAENAAPNWRGHSDTETLLYAVRHWGVEAALRRFIGMFAFAIWDAREQTLTLCRDRFGEKPLFYGWIDGDLVFASELKALSAHPRWSGIVDRDALTSFMRYSYVPAPWTIWNGVRKLPPSSFAVFTLREKPGDFPRPTQYWSMRDKVVSGQGERLRDPVQATDELERLLSQSVTRQSLSDVPLGAFLSGGIDSSTIVALMQKQSTRPIRTFSIGFAEAEFNEAEHARGIATHLGTDHTEMIVSPSDARSIIPNLSQMYDEPFGDSSQIPTHLVAALARKSVTVSLSGDGGDELFGGYNRHVWGGRLHARFGTLPHPVKRALALLIALVAPEPANSIGQLAGKVLPRRFRLLRAGDQLAKIGRIVDSKTLDEMYRRLSSIDDEPASAVVGGNERASWFNDEMVNVRHPIDPLDRMTLSDALSYLSDDILQKVDRAAMAVSLETRVPFLDKDVAEFSCRVPPDMKVKEGQGKWLVRQVLERHVPGHLTERPKTGFGIPLDDWLRGPLKEWAADLLAGERLTRQGWFDAARVQSRWQEHLHGTRNHGAWLWNVLMAESWADRWVKPARAASLN